MKKISSVILLFLLFTGAIPFLSSFTSTDINQNNPIIKFPYKKSGLTERQAAAHLLSRFTYGATPNQIDEVVKMGLENWFQQQLLANQSDDSLNALLSGYETLSMKNEEIVKTFPRNNQQVLKKAMKDGVIAKDSGQFDKKEYRDQVEAYMKANGLKPERELIRQLINQKILHAAYSNNQLQEVMTSFWFNHFNVSLTKNDCIHFVTCYEKDVIRPNALGKFGSLLLATAKSPAMLTYLDNFRSVANESGSVANEAGARRLRELYAKQLELRNSGDTSQQFKDVIDRIKKSKNAQGLNENYAREVMELHTLGVDGGYTQSDVTYAAKVLTGWTIFPMGNTYGGKDFMTKLIEKVGEDKLRQQGFLHDGDFMFTPNKHDKTEKTILGKKFPANEGYEEGVRLLDMLAHHSSTAHFISKKLAVHFVCDNPPTSLIEKMANSFLNSDGDIKQVLLTMVNAPEFWSKESVREKIKSPFELTVSTVRALNAGIAQPYQLANWINKMGERMYYYQAPTGFPDRAKYWINTGSLLNRMNFGLALASQRIPGVSFNLAALNNYHEPESNEAALATYCKIMMPERNVDETVKRLTPLINDPTIHDKVDVAAGKTVSPQEGQNMTEDEMMTSNKDKKGKKVKDKNEGATITQMQLKVGNNSMINQVTGIIIGSPEFQRR